MVVLEGEYGRPAGARTLGRIVLAIWVLMTAGMVLFLWHVLNRVPHPPFATLLLGVFVLAFAAWIVTLWRRIGFRYVLRAGMLSALGGYGSVMWTERLENLQAIRYSRVRGVIQLTLVWPERQREMMGIPSLLHALDASRGRGG